MATATRRTAAKLNLLTTKQVQHAGDDEQSDGGGLLLRVRGESCSWVMRYIHQNRRERATKLRDLISVATRGEEEFRARAVEVVRSTCLWHHDSRARFRIVKLQARSLERMGTTWGPHARRAMGAGAVPQGPRSP